MAKRIVHPRLFLLLAALPLAALLAQPAPATPNPVVTSATGSGHMVRPDGTFRSFSFAATKRADGTVTGQVQLNSRRAVQDNGEGPDAAPDRVSTIPENPGNADPMTCEDDNSDRPLARIVQRGDVQVRGG